MDSDDKLTSEELRGRVEYWKQIASIQMHFNDLCIRTRWLGLTAVATLVAAAAVSEKENIRFSLPFCFLHSIGLPSVLMLISLMVLGALWFLDLHYYYKMLIASVDYGETLERAIVADLKITNGGITSHISANVSRGRASGVAWMFYILVGAVIFIFLVGSFLPRLSDHP
ncbi:MAG: hypothetical protein ACLQLT_12765 [Methylovirgula sp.]